MQNFTKGQKSPLAHLTEAQHLTLTLQFHNPGQLTLDAALFGVNAEDRLSDDRYMTFYNQPQSPEGALRMLPGQGGELQRFEVQLQRLPAHVQKLVVTVTIDGPGTFADLPQGTLTVLQGNTPLVSYTVRATEFQQEKALIFLEIYFKGQWRIGAVGQGFAGGLGQLLRHYGGVEETPAPAPPKLSKGLELEKKVQAHPQGKKLINLVKQVNLTLEKKGLQDEKASVVLVMDATGSMKKQYQNGNVQKVVDRMGVLAMRLDDDGQLETWFYASEFHHTEDVTLQNIDGYVARTVLSESGRFLLGLGGANNEPPVLRALIEKHKGSKRPVLVLFITDGGVSQTGEIKRLITEAARYPIFFQFVGLAGRNYGVLEKLDTLEGRVVDNANFFAVDDISDINDEELYSRLLIEFPMWLKNIRKLKFI